MQKIKTVIATLLLLSMAIVGILTGTSFVKASASDTTMSIPSNGMVCYWKMNDGSGPTALDSSGNGYDIALTGCTWVSGHTGTAVQLNGASDEAVSPYTTILASATQVSVTLWVKCSASSGLKYFVQHDAFGIWQNNNDFGMAINIPGTSSAIGKGNMSAWNFFAGTYDGTNIKCYINGYLTNTTNHPGTMTSSTHNLVIGYFNSAYWAGTIDDLIIYNRALSWTEVQGIYNSVPEMPGFVAIASIGIFAAVFFAVLITRREKSQ